MFIFLKKRTSIVGSLYVQSRVQFIHVKLTKIGTVVKVLDLDRFHCIFLCKELFLMTVISELKIKFII